MEPVWMTAVTLLPFQDGKNHTTGVIIGDFTPEKRTCSIHYIDNVAFTVSEHLNAVAGLYCIEPCAALSYVR
jgi:hypothetical protein